tara:strand:- start:242 stop:442 length:201 start_codon:yes stop_codon:yes gene_type:complete
LKRHPFLPSAKKIERKARPALFGAWETPYNKSPAATTVALSYSRIFISSKTMSIQKFPEDKGHQKL